MERVPLTLRIPEDLHSVIKGMADISERSFNSQVLFMIRYAILKMQEGMDSTVIATDEPTTDIVWRDWQGYQDEREPY